MDMNNVNIEEIVKQVLSGMTGNAPAAAAAPSAPAAPAGNTIPKKARVAMMTEKKHFELQEYDLPEVGDDDILVKVEGCGVCGTDAHEYKNDPFGLIPVVLGHEGTGEIVKMGKNVKVDTAGKPVKVGDKIVTCMIFKDDPEITMFDLNKKNVGGADVYGLLPDDDVKFNGWFADYIFIRGGKFGSTFFNVSDLDLDSRILIEPCAVLVHAVERAKTTGILKFNSRVVVQGCGPIGLICIAVLHTMGVHNICAVDGNEKRLEFAKRMGANTTVNFMNFKGIEALTEAVKEAQGGHLQISLSSVLEILMHTPTSTNSSATAAVFASLVSSSMVETLQSTRTSTSAPKRSTLLVPGYTTSETMQQHLISLREQKQSDFRCLS